MRACRFRTSFKNSSLSLSLALLIFTWPGRIGVGGLRADVVLDCVFFKSLPYLFRLRQRQKEQKETAPLLTRLIDIRYFCVYLSAEWRFAPSLLVLLDKPTSREHVKCIGRMYIRPGVAACSVIQTALFRSRGAFGYFGRWPGSSSSSQLGI